MPEQSQITERAKELLLLIDQIMTSRPELLRKELEQERRYFSPPLNRDFKSLIQWVSHHPESSHFWLARFRKLSAQSA